MTGLLVRAATNEDVEGWLRLRLALWPHGEEAEFLDDIRRLLDDGRAFVAEEDERLVGFAEFSLRPYAEGCESSPVPYLEGWYVRPDARRRGYGRALVSAFESWAREHGFREVASDVLLENTESQQAHEALGFQEVERLVVYRKELTRE
ncbi:aminoglycoside 6'-N-acetyltransferase [Deinococcus yavapaiensis]|uniref:Aminoglycoside N(6')-acetyltransferase type 1 n=1 Tax=Deinococcus yavapaiensis KR-236 TaxID=694435 RepID=A0A318STI2_9DEIO|nr:aminoglycoside 6'-N-acetyltransferase [Deinococcus yavapaiensis]PYE56546.1 aminoglycoside 6'-N-acetyltransferase I [Deinococcus yavapaiensis KR-236]